MSEQVHFVSELYEKQRSTICHICAARGVSFVIRCKDRNISSNTYRLCYRCVKRDIYYPKLYTYYAGMTGYITLYADMEELLTMEYSDSDDDKRAENNLSEAKTKRKL